jgi:hypothetical protein
VTVDLLTARGEAQRALFFGVTRSGKTTLMQELLRPLRSVVIFDSKQVPQDWQSWGPAHGYVVTADPAEVRRRERVILEVDSRWLDDTQGWRRPGSLGWCWTEALGSALYRASDQGSTVVVFDEAMQTLPVGRCHPDARRLATTGAGMGLPVWLGSQAANWVDLVVLAMAEHCFAFATQNFETISVLSKRRGVDSRILATLHGPDPTPDDPRGRRCHEFAYHFVGRGQWELFSPLRLATKSRVREPAANTQAVQAVALPGQEGGP